MRLVHTWMAAALLIAAVVQIDVGTTAGDVTVQVVSREQPATVTLQNPNSESKPSLGLPLTFARHVGDLDGMKKRHVIRVLVVPSHSGFFYDKGIPHGIYYEAFDEFQRFANQKLRPDAVKVTVYFIPVRPEQLERALLEGVGDVVGYGVIVTPERKKAVLFTTPIDSNVKQVVVTGPKAPNVTNMEELSGKEVYVNPLTDYYQNLQLLSKEPKGPESHRSL